MFRAEDLIDSSILAQKSVAVLGVGSGGGHIAQYLPPLLRQLILVDDDVLAIENVERHLLGMGYIGQPKVEGVRHHLIEHYGCNPDVILAIQNRGEEVLDQLEDVDVIIEATGNPLLRYSLNTWAYDYDKPVIYAGVYAGGGGWRVIALNKPKELCYQCIELQTINSDIEPQADPSYGIDMEEPVATQLHASTGLITSVVPAAAMAVKLATDVLMGRPIEAPIYRHTDQPRSLLQLRDPTSIRAAQIMIELQLELGLNQFELIANSEGFTLQQNPGTIRTNIRQAPGCPLHMARKRKRS